MAKAIITEKKNDIYDEIKGFLQDHPISELLQIIADVIGYALGE